MHPISKVTAYTFFSLAIFIAHACSRKASNAGGGTSQTPDSPSALPDTSNTSPSQSGGTERGGNSSGVISHSTGPIAGVEESKPLCGFSIGKVTADTSSTRSMRFATFNIYGAFSTSLSSFNTRLELIAQSIQKSNSDVVGIQEAEDMNPAGVTVSLLSRRLSELTGETWYWCFFRSNPHVPLEPDSNVGGAGPLSLSYSQFLESNTKNLGQATWFMGDAIVSRLPFGSAGARRVSPRVASEEGACQTEQCRTWARGESRVVIRAEIVLQGRSVHFFNSHFYTDITPESVKSQTRQASEINTYIDQVVARRTAPVAVACDCNSPDSGPVRAQFMTFGFTDAWSAANPGVAGFTGGQSVSASSLTAATRIDYLFLKGLTAMESQLFPAGPGQVSNDSSVRWPSDHLGVYAGPF